MACEHPICIFLHFNSHFYFIFTFLGIFLLFGDDSQFSWYNSYTSNTDLFFIITCETLSAYVNASSKLPPLPPLPFPSLPSTSLKQGNWYSPGVSFFGGGVPLKKNSKIHNMTKAMTRLSFPQLFPLHQQQ